MHKTFLFTLLIFFGLAHADHDSEYHYLDQLAIEAGADKGSFYHNYTDIYSRYFADLKDKPIKFLEIGIYKGASVKMWEKYFTAADLHFIDITFDNAEYSSPRSHYYLCNQESVPGLQKFIQDAGGNFDVIINDGGHTMNQQITSFKTLFPHVKRGGMYIIEDLHTSYWSSWPGGNTRLNTMAFLKSLIDDVNFVGARTGRASHLAIDHSISKEMNLYQEQIASMHFYDSVVVIMKR